jgi:hypothetical protein
MVRILILLSVLVLSAFSQASRCAISKELSAIDSKGKYTVRVIPKRKAIAKVYKLNEEDNYQLFNSFHLQNFIAPASVYVSYLGQVAILGNFICTAGFKSHQLKLYDRNGGLLKEFKYEDIYAVGEDKKAMRSKYDELFPEGSREHWSSFKGMSWYCKSKQPYFKDGHFVVTDTVGGDLSINLKTGELLYEADVSVCMDEFRHQKLLEKRHKFLEEHYKKYPRDK